MVATEVSAVESGAMPSMPLVVFVPVASAVPAAAESVTGDEAEWVVHCEATGNCIIVMGVSLPATVRL